MAGVKGRSGGHNRVSPELHLLRRTFRPSRHGSREAARAVLHGHGSTSGANALQPAPGVPEPPPALVTGLGERGGRLVLDLWAQYGEWSPAKLVLLHELGGVADVLERYEGLVASEMSPVAPGGVPSVTNSGATIARLRAQAQRTFGLLLAHLDLKD